MSLQAKIEAVIYASEEPVTLQQLMGLLGQEAQAELDALDSQQGSLALEPEDEPAGEAAGDADALNAEVLESAAGEEMVEAPAQAEAKVAEADSAARSDNESAGFGGSDQEDESAAADTPFPEVGAGAADSLTGEGGRPDEPAADEADSAARNHDQSAVPKSSDGGESSAPADDRKAARDKERRLREYFRTLLDRLIAEYANTDRGLEIREVAGGFRMATKPEYHDAVRGFVKSLKPPLKLSLQALETLAVIAYKQPVTAPEISEIRGVESGGVLGTLMARKLIGTAGRKAVIGRPMLYKTTKEFLVRFGLKDVNELPSIEEFEKMAGELNDPVQEEIPMEQVEGRSSESVELTSGDGSPVVDELNAAPVQTGVGESADEVADARDGRADAGHDGAQAEPSSGVSEQAARSVERSRDIHEAQADGVPDDGTAAIDNHEPYTGSDQTGA